MKRPTRHLVKGKTHTQVKTKVKAKTKATTQRPMAKVSDKARPKARSKTVAKKTRLTSSPTAPLPKVVFGRAEMAIVESTARRIRADVEVLVLVARKTRFTREVVDRVRDVVIDATPWIGINAITECFQRHGVEIDASTLAEMTGLSPQGAKAPSADSSEIA